MGEWISFTTKHITETNRYLFNYERKTKKYFTTQSGKLFLIINKNIFSMVKMQNDYSSEKIKKSYFIGMLLTVGAKFWHLTCHQLKWSRRNNFLRILNSSRVYTVLQNPTVNILERFTKCAIFFPFLEYVSNLFLTSQYYDSAEY